jgi:hypothetical protein
MSKTEFEKIRQLDDLIEQEGGLGLDPFGNARYDYRAIIEQAQSHNIATCAIALSPVIAGLTRNLI